MSNIFLHRRGWIAGILAAVVVFIVVNVGADKIVGVRLDLTQDRLYTLSEGTKSVLETLPKPVTVTFYYSEELGRRIPQYASFANRIEDMLQEMAAVSNGNLTVEKVNPEPFSEAEDEAVELGLQGVPVDDSGDKVYFGVNAVADDPENSRGIPFFQADRDTFLEYDLMKMIWRTTHPEPAVVGVISSKEVFGNPFGRNQDPWYLLIQMQDFFDTRRISSAESLIENDPDMLLIIHPAGLDDDLVYGIDQFMLRGGRAIILADPWNETAASVRLAPGQPSLVPESSDLPRIFDAWGIEIPQGQTIGDRSLASMVNAGGEGQVKAAPYISWIAPKEANRNMDDAVMASVKDLVLPTPGSIEVKDGATVTVTPLITTTTDATTVPVDNTRKPDPLKLLDGYEPTGKSYVLAARITGNVKTAFPDGPPVKESPPEEGGSDEAATDGADASETEPAPEEPKGPDFGPHLSESAEPLNVILIADADMAQDPYWVNVRNFFGQRVAVPYMDNGNFILSGLENLEGSNELLGLRARRNGKRPFELIDNLRLAAEDQFRSEEQALQQKLQETESKLAELQQGQGDGGGAVTEEQQAAVDAFTQELLDIRRNLRQVNLKLREDIEALQAKLRFVNIALVPILVAVFAIGLGIFRARRRSVSS
ncbi:GldG family protein [Hwanghaeella sp.]|uniref:GldG family protein n=1 Tax=Hwanghaeella sp. TaxID=2605943 RepID=UPI003CCBBD45